MEFQEQPPIDYEALLEEYLKEIELKAKFFSNMSTDIVIELPEEEKAISHKELDEKKEEALSDSTPQKKKRGRKRKD